MAFRIVIQCVVCGQDISLEPSRAAVRKTCSRKCQATHLWDRRRITPVATQKPIEERFWSKVDKTPGHGPNGDCWLWTGRPDRFGYGIISYKGKFARTHVCSYSMHHGGISKGLQVLHKCDIPGCVNPDHLWLGTNADNMADRKAKGRYATASKGSTHYKAKLNEDDVRRIRADPRDHLTIAAEYGTSRSNVGNIKHRRAWKHVA